MCALSAAFQVKPHGRSVIPGDPTFVSDQNLARLRPACRTSKHFAWVQAAVCQLVQFITCVIACYGSASWIGNELAKYAVW
jgi:hypothetical protein